MIQFIIRHTIKDYQDTENKDVRERYGVLAGVLGIVCNTFLCVVKLIIGTAMNSIAITSDAMNNLSDMGSSLVAMIGAKLSNRRPDKEHPFGHGRIEYISSLIISFLIMLVGVELLKGSAVKIIHPEPVLLQPVLMVILALSVLVKVWMFFYNRYIGKAINSSVQRATASDSLNDVIATGAVILTTVLGHFLQGIPVDGIVGVAVSLLVLYTGFSIAKDTVGMLLGTPPDPEVVHNLTEEILSGEGIVGVHDLVVHDYGPGRVMASAHAEVPDDANVVKIHEVIDGIEQKIEQDLGIVMVLHMDPISVNCEKTDQIKARVAELAKSVNPAFSIHDFRMTDGEGRINLIFDLAMPCELDEKQRLEAERRVRLKIQEEDPRYRAVIKMDTSF